MEQESMGHDKQTGQSIGTGLMKAVAAVDMAS